MTKIMKLTIVVALTSIALKLVESAFGIVFPTTISRIAYHLVLILAALGLFEWALVDKQK